MKFQKLIEAFKTELPKFEVVVSNPPYQDEDSGAGSASMPIYQHFQDVSLLIANITSMIYKDNWTTAMNDDRNGLHDWRKSLIESQRLVDVLFMGDIFPGTSVSVTIVLCKLQGSNIFNKYNPNIPITKTVDQILTKTQSIVNVQSRVLTYGKNSLGYTQKEIRAAKIENKASGKIKFIDLDNREPFFADLNLTLIGEIALKSNWKVGYHATRPWKQHTEDRIFHIKSQELPAEKILMLNFDSEEEFENYKAYVKTKLWGYLAMKSTNDISGPVGHLSFIPWLDYTNNNPLFKSDEELSEDHEYYGLTLDQRLYKYFNLTDEEISIIEDSF